MKSKLNGPSAVDEPARATPVFGEYDVVVLGGGPAGIAAAASSAGTARTRLLVERYGFLGGMGTAAGVTNFCGLHANVHGEIRQVVHGVADDLLERMRGLGGLNEPHLIFGKIFAQAYDTAAFKCAADALLLAQRRGIAVPCLRGRAWSIAAAAPTVRSTPSCWKRNPAASRSGPDLHRLLRRRRPRPPRRPADGQGRRPWRPALPDAHVPRRRHRSGARRRGMEDDPGAHGRSRALRRVPLPAPRRDRAAAAASERMARQRHAAEECRRQRDRRHRCRIAVRRRDRRPAPGRRLPRASFGQACPASRTPTRSTSRRSWASARRAGWSAKSR